MSWKDIVKLKGKQKNLDKNHNGVIDAQDFYIMNGSDDEKKAQPITAESSKKIIGLIADQKEALSLIDEVARRLYGGETVELSKVERLAAINLRQSEKVRLALVSLIEVLEGV